MKINSYKNNFFVYLIWHPCLQLNGASNFQYKMDNYGSFLEKWSRDGTVMLGYDFMGNPIPDVGLRCELTYNPETLVKGLTIGAKCAKEKINASCAVC